MTTLDVIISISSVVLSVSGILYCRHVAKHAGRDRPRDPEAVQRFVDKMLYDTSD